MQYIIDALTIDVPLSLVRCVPSSSITSSYLSLLLPLTPVLFTNELPRCTLSIPPIPSHFDTVLHSWAKVLAQIKQLYISARRWKSITGMDINAERDLSPLWKWEGSQIKANKMLLVPSEIARLYLFTVFSAVQSELRIALSAWNPYACDLMCFRDYLEPITVWGNCSGQFGGPSDWHWGVKCRCLKCENVSWQDAPLWFLVLHTSTLHTHTPEMVPIPEIWVWI